MRFLTPPRLFAWLTLDFFYLFYAQNKGIILCDLIEGFGSIQLLGMYFQLRLHGAVLLPKRLELKEFLHVEYLAHGLDVFFATQDNGGVQNKE